MEIRRILVTGGIIRVVVPDFDKVVNDYSKNNNPEKFIDDSCLVGKKPKTIFKKNQYLIQGMAGILICIIIIHSLIYLEKINLRK